MMKISDASIQLRALSKAQAQNQLSFDNYLHERKQILDALDHSMNGIINTTIDNVAKPLFEELDEQAIEVEEPQDKTQPFFAGKVDKYINIIKGTNKQ